MSVFDELIRDARKEGQFDSGIVDIKASTIDLSGDPKVCDGISLPCFWCGYYVELLFKDNVLSFS